MYFMKIIFTATDIEINVELTSRQHCVPAGCMGSHSDDFTCYFTPNNISYIHVLCVLNRNNKMRQFQ